MPALSGFTPGRHSASPSAFRPLILDRNSSAVDPAELAQACNERSDPWSKGDRIVPEKSYRRQPSGLLRTSRRRPACGAADEHNEVTSPHAASPVPVPFKLAHGKPGACDMMSASGSFAAGSSQRPGATVSAMCRASIQIVQIGPITHKATHVHACSIGEYRGQSISHLKFAAATSGANRPLAISPHSNGHLQPCRPS